MKSPLIRELIEGGSTGPVRVLSIFVFEEHMEEDRFDSELAAALSTTNLFERLHVVGIMSHLKKVNHWLRDGNGSGERIRRILKDFDNEVAFIAFDPLTCSHKVLNGEMKIALPPMQEWLKSERRASLMHAFDKSGGMMTAPRGFHYKKTSTQHSTRFLRTANVLEAPEHLALVAFWLLPIVGQQGVDQVIVDTSGIYSAALLAVHQISQVRKPNMVPKIWSHNSFNGLEEIDRISKNSVCLISATTSGTLREGLLAKGAAPSKVWTIFGLAKPGKVLSNLLCDLSEAASSSKTGFEHIENESPGSCRYCLNGSLAVQIAGDQFVLEPPTVSEIDFGMSDLPEPNRRLLGELVGTGLLKVFRARSGRIAGNHEIFLDVSSLFSYLSRIAESSLSEHWRKFQAHWVTLKARTMTANVQRVVYTSHPFSMSLAEEIASEYERFGLKKPLVLPQSQLPRVSGDDSSGTIVAAACLDDTQELMVIKRDLRDVQKYGSIWFAAPLLRGVNAEFPEKVRKLIGYGEFGAGTFSVQHCCFISLPDCESPTVWDAELQLVRDMKEFALVNGEEVPEDLVKRERLLELASVAGMGDNLFWPTPKGEGLMLRNEFTLIHSTRAFSQADVYVVIASFLHQLRLGSPNGNRLLYTPFARSVLSPNLFIKFNDGVLQAALLRAARDHELHFANCEDATSQMMLGVLLNELQELDLGRGDALSEFLVALADRRLTMMTEHTIRFCDEVEKSNAPEMQKLMARYLRQLL